MKTGWNWETLSGPAVTRPQVPSGPGNRTPAEVFQADRAIQEEEEESKINEVLTVVGTTGRVIGTLAWFSNKAYPANRVHLAYKAAAALRHYYIMTLACLSCGCTRSGEAQHLSIQDIAGID